MAKNGILNFDKEKIRRLFIKLNNAKTVGNEEEYHNVRDKLFLIYQPLCKYLAGRFKDRGETKEDLTQVANIGLSKAIDRFDLNRGVIFRTYATLTIIGELKRHFRDKTWDIRVPRRLQEAGIKINQATEELSQILSRSPTIREIANRLCLTEDEVIEAISARKSYSLVSLDGQLDSEYGENFSLDVYLWTEDLGFTRTENLSDLKDAVEYLSPQEQKILYLRFFNGYTQTQIAEMLGISQMHVSRKIRKALSQLRDRMISHQPTFNPRNYDRSIL